MAEMTRYDDGDVALLMPSNLRQPRQAMRYFSSACKASADKPIVTLAVEISADSEWAQTMAGIALDATPSEWMGVTVDIVRQGEASIGDHAGVELLATTTRAAVNDTIHSYSVLLTLPDGYVYITIMGRGPFEQFDSICQTIVTSIRLKRIPSKDGGTPERGSTKRKPSATASQHPPVRRVVVFRDERIQVRVPSQLRQTKPPLLLFVRTRSRRGAMDSLTLELIESSSQFEELRTKLNAAETITCKEGMVDVTAKVSRNGPISAGSATGCEVLATATVAISNFVIHTYRALLRFSEGSGVSVVASGKGHLCEFDAECQGVIASLRLNHSE